MTMLATCSEIQYRGDVLPAGLIYVDEYINEHEELALIEAAANDYQATRYDGRSTSRGETPASQKLSKKLKKDGYFVRPPKCVWACRYESNAGCEQHHDGAKASGTAIVSLGAHIVMDLTRKHKPTAIWLAPRSLLILRGESLTEWTHGIARRDYDNWNGQRIERGVRTSYIFR